jgi:hypothetical protein
MKKLIFLSIVILLTKGVYAESFNLILLTGKDIKPTISILVSDLKTVDQDYLL